MHFMAIEFNYSFINDCMKDEELMDKHENGNNEETYNQTLQDINGSLSMDKKLKKIKE